MSYNNTQIKKAAAKIKQAKEYLRVWIGEVLRYKFYNVNKGEIERPEPKNYIAEI